MCLISTLANDMDLWQLTGQLIHKRAAFGAEPEFADMLTWTSGITSTPPSQHATSGNAHLMSQSHVALYRERQDSVGALLRQGT